MTAAPQTRRIIGRPRGRRVVASILDKARLVHGMSAFTLEIIVADSKCSETLRQMAAAELKRRSRVR